MKRHDPMRVVSIAISATILILLVLVLKTRSEVNSERRREEERIRLAGLSGEILRLDEILTMSAKLAAASEDLVWEERYNQFDPVLVNVIAQLTTPETQPDGRCRFGR